MRVQQLRELRHRAGAVLQRHALDAGADAHVDHARADRVRDVDARLQPAGALAVDRLDGRAGGEAGGERRGAELGGAAAGGKDGADGDVLDEGGVDGGAGREGLEGVHEQVGGGGVFEQAFAAAGEGRAEGAGDDDVGGGFEEEGFQAAGDVDFGGGEVGGYLAEALLSWGVLVLER